MARTATRFLSTQLRHYRCGPEQRHGHPARSTRPPQSAWIRTVTDAEVALWTTLAAGIGSAISGVVAVVVTRRQVRSTENMSRETRYQDRILKAYLTLTRYADDSIAQVANDRAWLPGGPASQALAPELTREEMSFSWLVCSPEVARLHLKVTEAAVAYGRERAIRNDQLLNAGLDPAAIAKVVRGQTGRSKPSSVLAILWSRRQMLLSRRCGPSSEPSAHCRHITCPPWTK